MIRYRFLFLLFLTSVINSFAQTLPTIKITYNGNSATVNTPSTITDVDVTINDANVQITSSTTAAEYAYEVTGNSSDGSLLITGAYKLTLRLNGITLSSSKGAAIDIECGKRIAVELVEGTVNTLSDCAFGSQKAAFFMTGHPEFEGSGTLNVTGNTKHAICSKEYLELKKNTGTINILGAQGDGIHCGKGKVSNEHNYFEMKGGTINIANTVSDGIDSDDFGVVHIEGGAISISVDSDDATGIKADSILSVSGGVINITVKGKDSNGLKSSYETNITGGNLSFMITGDGSKAIKCKDGTSTVLNGGNFSMEGGSIESFIVGGHIIVDSDTTKCIALSVDRNYTQSDGEIHIYAYGPESYTYKVKGSETKSGGILNCVRGPWKLIPTDYQFDMSSFVILKINDKTIRDYSNYAIGAFIGENCTGVGEFFDSNYGILRIHNNSTSEVPVTFKLYDYTTDKEYELEADRPVTFQSMNCYGTPSNPVVLSVTIAERLKCDVNEDGLVDISDIVAIIQQISGSATYRYADVNEDSYVDISDIVSIIKYISRN